MVPAITFQKDAQNSESLALAYDEAVKTYDWSLRRFDTWDGNLDKILAWGSPISILAIGKILSNDISSGFPHLYLVIASFALGALAIAFAFFGKQTGKIDLIDPAKKIANWLTLDPDAYRLYAVRDAGVAQEKNDRFVLRKANMATASVVCFSLSAFISALTWVVQKNPHLIHF